MVLLFAMSLTAPRQDLGGMVEFAADGKQDFVVLVKSKSNPVFGIDADKTHFEAIGSPIVQKNSSGLQVSGQVLSGTYVPQKNGTYKFDTLKSKGSSVLSFDSQRSRAYAKANSLPVVEPLHLIDLTTLTTENLDLVEKDQIVTTVIDHPFVLTDKSQISPSKDPKVTVAIPLWQKRESRFTGSSGTFRFTMPDRPNVGKVLTGEATGPVTFHSVETSFAPHYLPVPGHLVEFLAPVVKTFDAVADHLYVDMTKTEKQLNLKGHVKYRYSVNDFHSTSDQVFATVDEQGNVTNILAVGVPGDSVPKP